MAISGLWEIQVAAIVVLEPFLALPKTKKGDSRPGPESPFFYFMRNPRGFTYNSSTP